MKKKLIAMICFMLMIMMMACGAAKDAESKVPEASGETEDETAAEEETKEQGPGVENLRLQAEEAIENEDFDGALSLAQEAGAIDPAVESAIKDQVKDAWGKKIDSAIDSDDYETAMSLIEEGNNVSTHLI